MPREVSVLIVLALLGSIIHGFVISDIRRRNNPKAKGNLELVRSLRKQLMANNYDYMSMESEEPFPPRRAFQESSPQPPPPETDREPALDDIFIPHTFDDSLSVAAQSDDRGIDKNDLLYYVDNDRLKKNSIEMQRAFSFEDNSLEKTTSPKVKYKVLKVKVPGGPRRSGAAFRSFVQEEGPRGVALVSLGGEPFPGFRLPRRRSGADADLEIASLSDFSAEMLARSDSFQSSV